jgi:hypothetical protein
MDGEIKKAVDECTRLFIFFAPRRLHAHQPHLTTMDANVPGGFDLSALSSVLNDPR